MIPAIKPAKHAQEEKALIVLLASLIIFSLNRINAKVLIKYFFLMTIFLKIKMILLLMSIILRLKKLIRLINLKLKLNKLTILVI